MFLPRRVRTGMAVAAVGFLFSVSTGCVSDETVPENLDDATAPELHVEVTQLNQSLPRERFTDMPAGHFNNIGIRYGETVFITAKTRDSDGVKSVTIEGELRVTCRTPSGTEHDRTITIDESRSATSEYTSETGKRIVVVPVERILTTGFSTNSISSYCEEHDVVVKFTGHLAARAYNSANMATEPVDMYVAYPALRVATYNIHGIDNEGYWTAPDGSWSLSGFAVRLREFARVLAGMDFILLQEVGQPDQATRLADALGMPYVAQGRMNDASPSDVAIISRWPLESVTSLQLTYQCLAIGTCAHNARPALVVATANVRGSKYVVGNLHLTSNGVNPVSDREENRLVQVREAMAMINLLSGRSILPGPELPIILGGDFNSVRYGPVINEVEQLFVDSKTSGPFTWSRRFCGEENPGPMEPDWWIEIEDGREVRKGRIDFIFLHGLDASYYQMRCSDPGLSEGLPLMPLTDHPLIEADAAPFRDTRP